MVVCPAIPGDIIEKSEREGIAMGTTIIEQSVLEFKQWLVGEDRQPGTIEKYVRDIRELMDFLKDDELTNETVSIWKAYLLSEKGLAPITINSKLAAVGTYCRFAGIDCRVRFYKIQRKLFYEDNKNLQKDEYLRLLEAAAKAGNKRIALIIETIGATGIRVSELKYITVETVHKGIARIHLKGKIRTIILPGKLRSKLLKYARKRKIASGEIFITKSGKSISRKQIWAEMKALCERANVERSKVFPHNLRHLFAKLYYKATRDIAKLADLLGHSTIETTRIYLLTTEYEHSRQLNNLGLVL